MLIIMIMIIINDDVNMVQSGAHLVGEILPPSGGENWVTKYCKLESHNL